MNWRNNLIPMSSVVVFSGLLITNPAHTQSAQFDQAMAPIVTQYLIISGALAKDQTEGVVDAAKKIGRLVGKLDAKSTKGTSAKSYAQLPAQIKKAAEEIAAAKEIQPMREALKLLSRPLVTWATTANPKGIYVVSCSMAKASWLQKTKAIENPYYGASMLRCGEMVGDTGKHAD